MAADEKFTNLVNENKEFEILSDGSMAAFDINPVLHHRPGKNPFDPMDIGGIYLGDEFLEIQTKNQKLISLVIDIGSTTISASLVDNKKGVEIAHKSGLNPQRQYGDDVISRTTFVIENKEGLEILQKLVLEQIKNLAEELIEENSYNLKDLYAVFVASNAIMNHILLGLSPAPLARSPYQLQFTGKKSLDFSDIGMKEFGKGKLVAVPNITAFVGGDLTAGIISTEIYKSRGTELLIDIGTNGELILNHEGKMYSTSCAAGPALEGMGISCGVTAQPGAIEEAKAVDDQLILQNINHEPSIGICGSGVLAVIREFLKIGLINSRGNIQKQDKVSEELHHFYVEGQKALWVDRDQEIFITQKDIRQLQMAKGAILTGIECLLDFADVEADELEKVYIAGQFGSYLSPDSLTRVGLLPAAFHDKIHYVGNTSKSGCFMISLNKEIYEKVDGLVRNIKHLSLTRVENFDLRLAKATLFPK